jgi:hypothetical protein
MSERDPVALRLDDGEDRLSVEAIAEQTALSADLTPLPRERLRAGARLALGLLALTGVVLVLIAVFAGLTYPSLDDTRHLMRGCRPESAGCNVLDAQQQRTTSWFGNVKDLLQLLVVSLLIPLVATLIGYLFGGQSDREERNAG